MLQIVLQCRKLDDPIKQASFYICIYDLIFFLLRWTVTWKYFVWLTCILYIKYIFHLHKENKKAKAYIVLFIAQIRFSKWAQFRNDLFHIVTFQLNSLCEYYRHAVEQKTNVSAIETWNFPWCSSRSELQAVNNKSESVDTLIWNLITQTSTKHKQM